MRRTVDWRGTWLQAVWLILPRRLGQWPVLVEAWSHSSMLDRGTALLTSQRPELVTHESAQEPRYLPELRWSGDRSAIVAALYQHLPYRLGLEIPDGSGITELRLSVGVNTDGSLSVSLSAPLGPFEEDGAVGRRRFRDFVDTCGQLFVPGMMFAGTIGEEAQLRGVATLISDIDRWTGRGFYGADLMAPMLAADLSGTGAELRIELEGGGLFVSWAGWPRWEQAPQSWRQAVLSCVSAETQG